MKKRIVGLKNLVILLLVLVPFFVACSLNAKDDEELINPDVNGDPSTGTILAGADAAKAVDLENVKSIKLYDLEENIVDKEFSNEEISKIIKAYNESMIDDTMYIEMITGNKMVVSFKDGATITFTSYGDENHVVANGEDFSYHLICPYIGKLLLEDNNSEIIREDNSDKIINNPSDDINTPIPKSSDSDTGTKKAQNLPKSNQGITVNTVKYTEISNIKNLPTDIQGYINAQEDKHFSKVVKDSNSQYVYIQLGMRNTSGYLIDILSVEDVEGKISVVYEEVRPSPDAMTAQVITYPWKVLKIDSALPITIREHINSEQEIK